MRVHLLSLFTPLLILSMESMAECCETGMVGGGVVMQDEWNDVRCVEVEAQARERGKSWQWDGRGRCRCR